MPRGNFNLSITSKLSPQEGILQQNKIELGEKLWGVTSLRRFLPRGYCGVIFCREATIYLYRITGKSAPQNGSLKNWELQISCFKEFLGGENVLGLVPASLPHTLGYACTFYAPHFPSPNLCLHEEKFVQKSFCKMISLPFPSLPCSSSIP